MFLYVLPEIKIIFAMKSRIGKITASFVFLWMSHLSADVPVEMKISPYHQKYFSEFSKNSFNAKETGPMLEKMNLDGNMYCQMLYRQKRYNASKAETFIRPAILDHFKKKPQNYPLHNLITGCWNFFRLNDIFPNEDFELVKFLFPTEKKECFSVGFMQPYFMHGHLGCSNLTMLDIDWRILYGHNQVMTLMKQNSMTTESEAEKTMRKIKAGWLARYDEKPMEMSIQADITKFCFPKYKKLCLAKLVDFQNQMKNLNHVELQLSYLHDANYSPKYNNSKLIIFLSNAIDDNYTTRKQFDELLQNIQNSLNVNQSAIFIHHSAGRRQFGLYDFKKLENSFQLTTICRDNFLTAPVVKEQKFYKTHFDKATTSRGKLPACHDMLAKFQKEEKLIKTNKGR